MHLEQVIVQRFVNWALDNKSWWQLNPVKQAVIDLCWSGKESSRTLPILSCLKLPFVQKLENYPLQTKRHTIHVLLRATLFSESRR